nr:retrovirus-related Pol polyprotein from transposon TNT 1-94 [Tanacetum cinerariifolium]
MLNPLRVLHLRARVSMNYLQLSHLIYVEKQWKVHQFDVKSAFLNGDLHDEVYVDQPPGFEDASCLDKVLRLKKALYSLKQAPRAWYSKINEFFQKEGFKKSKHEPTLYVKKEGLEVIQKQEGIFLSQKKYIDDTLKKYNMINYNIEYTPMNPEEKFQAEDETQLADGG